MRVFLTLVAVAACSSPAPRGTSNQARPDAGNAPRSWAAVKGALPAHTDTVLAIDLRALRATPSFAKLAGGVPMLASAAGTVKAQCGLDLFAVITDVTLVGNNKDRGVIAFGFDGIDEAKLLACGTKVKLADHRKGRMDLANTNGRVVEYQTHDSETEHLFATWPAKDVAAFAIKHESAAGIEALLAGVPPTGRLAAALGTGFDGGSLAWGAFVNDKLTGHGSLAPSGGNIAFQMEVTADSAAAATALAEKQRKDMTEGAANIAEFRPGMAKVMKAMQISTAGAVVTLQASFPESELPAVFAELAEGMMGGGH